MPAKVVRDSQKPGTPVDEQLRQLAALLPRLERSLAARLSDAGELPSLPGLSVDVEMEIAWLHGQPHKLRSRAQAIALDLVAKAGGNWVSSTEMRATDSALRNEPRSDRIDRVFKRLPREIAALLDSSTRGYRIRLDKLA